MGKAQPAYGCSSGGAGILLAALVAVAMPRETEKYARCCRDNFADV